MPGTKQNPATHPTKQPTKPNPVPSVPDDTFSVQDLQLQVAQLATKVELLTRSVKALEDAQGPTPKGYQAVVMNPDLALFVIRTKDVNQDGHTSKPEAIAAAKAWISEHGKHDSYTAGVVEIY